MSVQSKHDRIKLKYVSNVEMGQSPESDACNFHGIGLPFLQGCGDFGSINPTASTYCDRPPKRALLSAVLVSVRAPVGTLNIAQMQYGIGRGLCAVSPREGVTHGKFLYYSLAGFMDDLARESTGSTYDAVSASDVGNLALWIPSLSAQRSIAEYLDRQTSKIDALLAKKQRLIELLDEERSALISRAVTRGLDPNSPMKESSMDWLGRIPAQWRELKLGLAAISMCDGPFGSDMKSSHYSDEGVRLIRLQNIGRGQFKDTDQAFIPESHFRSLPGHDAVPGDLLIAGLGDENHPVGRACILPKSVPVAMVKADCFRVRLGLAARHDYARWFLNSSFARAELESLVRGSTRTRINLSVVSQLKILLPPLVEQDAISEFLDKQTGAIQTVLAKTEEQIDKLREYRSALITAAVTGQLDIREHEKKMEALS